MISSVNSCLPPIFRRRVIIPRARLVRRRVQIFAVCSFLYRIIIPEQTATAQFRDQQIDDVLERAWLDRISLRFMSATTAPNESIFQPYQVKSVYIGLFDPAFHVVSHLRRCTNRSGTQTPHSDMLAHSGFSPFCDLGSGFRPAFNSRTKEPVSTCPKTCILISSYRMALLSTCLSSSSSPYVSKSIPVQPPKSAKAPSIDPRLR